MKRYPLVIVNGYPQELSETDRIYSGANVLRQNLEPANSVEGDMWFDTQNNLLKLYDGTGWSSVGGGSGGGSVTVSPTAPQQPSNGSMWYDLTENYLKVYLAASAIWVPAQMTFFVQDAAPTTGFYQGDIWYSPLANVFSMYIGGSTNAWTPMGSQLSVTDILAFG